jgi:hypothetical protein
VVSLEQNAGNFEGALPLAEDVLVVAWRINGDGHPDTLSCMSNLASLHRVMAKHDLALPLHTEAPAGRRHIPGR